jgi:hypothetical protein
MRFVAEDLKKGKFMTVEGDIDKRDKLLKDIELHNGFRVECGLRGGKLSGG